MIKYLGSKRTLVEAIAGMAVATQARTAVDLFTGTTRVAQALKRTGMHVTAVDIASYSEVLSDCFIATDATVVNHAELANVLAELNTMPGKRGYFTRTFCEESRFFQPKNGQRVDAIRDHLETHYRESPLFPVLLTALMLAADRVDSTTGVQMAYLKSWAARSHNDLELRPPDLIPGPGRSIRDDALSITRHLPTTDFLYVDPPYNQHRYYTNYHIWETLVRWDAPEHYGVACKRIDSRDESTKSVFNRKRDMPAAMSQLLGDAHARTVVVSYNDESWITPEQMLRSLRDAGFADARMLAFDYKRYVGAQIGIFNPAGTKVGTVSHLRNTEYMFIAGETDLIDSAAHAVTSSAAMGIPGATVSP